MDIFIEISKGTSIKYEYKEGKLKVDRFLNVPFAYPFNYGYIPNTICDDGDEIDAVVICEQPLHPCSYIKCKPIGVLKTVDEAGEDNKFIFVPDNSVDIKSTKINDIDDISTDVQKKIIYFFTHYKDLDPNKWINVLDNKIHNKETALSILGTHNLHFNLSSTDSF